LCAKGAFGKLTAWLSAQVPAERCEITPSSMESLLAKRAFEDALAHLQQFRELSY